MGIEVVLWFAAETLGEPLLIALGVVAGFIVTSYFVVLVFKFFYENVNNNI
ncbi:MAG: hypothetical protein AAF125_22270 [Chloroflexota bacterium]